ncbi:TolB family protein [Niabella insulamsoli]|uniref:hypothetical protein n=1 Tax=Niabella insulamsoli TaxID=3144874 RepID=UPI0031FD35B5
MPKCGALLFFVCYLVISPWVSAQQFGGTPFATKWRQIRSDTARIIFPEGLDAVAGRVAGLIQRAAKSRQLSLGNKVDQIDVVLQNLPVSTNGYVSLGPFRSEFYLTPSPNNFDPSGLSWPDQLTIHEYRHVQQFNNFNNGLSGVMKKLFGQEGYALAVNAAIPNWFFEGDAVYSETAFSPHGRGKLPYFLKAFPALWASDKNYSWMKLRNGSLKDYVPNHYDLGYLMVNYGVEKYGYDAWRHITKDASAYKGLFYPWQKAVKKHTGEKYTGFVHDAFEYYKGIYGTPTFAPVKGQKPLVPVNKKILTHYRFPFQLSDSSLLYQKSSNNQREAFYINSSGEEKILRVKDLSIDEHYSYRNGKIVYAAYENHPRWRWLGYSVIKILDINTGRQRSLQQKTRYFSPDISADGAFVVANKVSLKEVSTLVQLNADDGTIIKEIQNDSVAYFSIPKIKNDSTVISVVRKKDATTHIASINLRNGTIENITPPSKTIIGTIDLKDDRVYFTASRNLKDELFYVDINTKKIYTVATTGVGSYFINSDFGKLNWSAFTADGYQPYQADVATLDWQPVEWPAFTESSARFFSGAPPPRLAGTIENNFESKPYKKLTAPFNFHSWRPNYSDPEFSFTLYGNNILNTTQTEIYYLYNESDRTHTAGGALTYGGLFPFITLGSAYTFDRRSLAAKQIKNWDEWNSYIGVQIPLSWASRRTYKAFTLGSNYYYRSDFNKGPNADEFQALKFSYLAHGLSWSQQIQSTVQDIYPRLGYSTNLQFRHALQLYNSWQLYKGLNLYLPGIFRGQSLVLNGAIQYSGSRQRVFGNRIAYARGFAGRDSAGAYTARANYHFTLLYPDWGFANIFYLQRVRANAFYDHTVTFNKNNTQRTKLQSVGGEIFLDTKWWNQHPLTLGFRVGHLLNPQPQNSRKLFFEFILPTNLIPR